LIDRTDLKTTNNHFAVTGTLEKTNLTIGYIALTDCAPLVAAKRLGFFEQCGLDVTLSREPSWATLRDKLLAGVLDAAQLLAPLPMIQSMQHAESAIVTALVLSRHGNGLTLSKRLLEQWTADSGRSVPIPFLDRDLLIDFVRHSTQRGPLRLAVVHQHACHHYQVLDWLSILPRALRNQCEVTVVPPVAMVQALAQGAVHGICVGAPWNTVAVRQGVGITVATSIDIWGDHPEKVLGVRAQWHHANPNSHGALVCALVQAQRWFEPPGHRFEAACWLSESDHLNIPVTAIAPALLDTFLAGGESDCRQVDHYLTFKSTVLAAEGRASMAADGEYLLDKISTSTDTLRPGVASTFIENVYLSTFSGLVSQ
jgi:NitT/TauT family transport system ATP-binding protein/nitrate/nitrite transport system substrate-binding protein